MADDSPTSRRADDGQQLLIEAGRVLASSLDYEVTVRDAIGLFIPRLADVTSDPGEGTTFTFTLPDGEPCADGRSLRRS